jgi:hypothetical protein
MATFLEKKIPDAHGMVKQFSVKDEIGKAGEISLRPLIVQTLCNEKNITLDVRCQM